MNIDTNNLTRRHFAALALGAGMLIAIPNLGWVLAARAAFSDMAAAPAATPSSSLIIPVAKLRMENQRLRSRLAKDQAQIAQCPTH